MLISTVNCTKITRDRPGQPAYEICTIERDSDHLNFDLLG